MVLLRRSKTGCCRAAGSQSRQLGAAALRCCWFLGPLQSWGKEDTADHIKMPQTWSRSNQGSAVFLGECSWGYCKRSVNFQNLKKLIFTIVPTFSLFYGWEGLHRSSLLYARSSASPPPRGWILLAVKTVSPRRLHAFTHFINLETAKRTQVYMYKYINVYNVCITQK